MGIKKFKDAFAPIREIQLKELAGKSIAIDASVEIYRASIADGISNAILTDKSGEPTMHINTFLTNIIKYKSFGIEQYWVFDHIQDPSAIVHHNAMKIKELEKRREKRRKAVAKLDKLRERIKNIKIGDDALFSDDENEEEINKQITTQEKIAFKMEDKFRNNLILLLDFLEVPWVVAPEGCEAERLCAAATYDDTIFGKKIDYAFSSDADVLLFGGAKFIKCSSRIKTREYFLYEFDKLLEVYSITKGDFVKACLGLGTDFADKTKGIGPKTVLKKLQKFDLTVEQQKVYDDIMVGYKFNKKNMPEVFNFNKKSFTDKEKYHQLLGWISLVKDFKLSRVDNLFKKANLFSDVIFENF